MFGVANPLFGGASNEVSAIDWPQPTGYKTDMAKAKALMAEVGGGPDSRPRSPSISATASITSRSPC